MSKGPSWMRKSWRYRALDFWLSGVMPWYPWLWKQRWYQVACSVIDFAPLRLLTRKNVYLANLRWDIYVLVMRAWGRCPSCPNRTRSVKDRSKHKMACYNRTLKPVIFSLRGW